MNKHIYSLGLLAVLACSGGAGRASVRTATVATSAPRSPLQAPVTKNETASAPLEQHDESDSDRVFIENAERAIGFYSEFIARAGDSEEYAPAVKRSREQIADLRAAIPFVRAGAEQRAAH